MKKIKGSVLIGLYFIFFLTSCIFIPEISPNQSTVTVIITSTPAETNSAFSTSSVIPSASPAITEDPVNEIFVLQEGVPVYLENFAHPNLGCEWMGVAGQVFGGNGKPVTNLIVNIKGKLGLSEFDLVSLTGMPEANIYNPGSFEIKISDQPFRSESTLAIQLFDLNGRPLSLPVSFDTYQDCSKNLIIINFTKKAE